MERKYGSYGEAKSIHIFAWPFVYGKDENENKKFLKKIKENVWMEKSLDFRDYKEKHEIEQAKDFFMLEQYLSELGRDIFIKPQQDICRIFEYPLNHKQKNYYYIKADSHHTYRLLLDSIEMHLYHCGVGILFYHTLNMNPHTTIEDIKRMNDKGRRVLLPFIPDRKDGFTLTAEEIGIELEDRRIVTSFRKRISSFHNQYSDNTIGEMVEEKDLTAPAEFIIATINGTLKGEDIGEIQVECTSDDRMFVASLIRDNKLSQQIKNEFEGKNNQNLKQLIYSILYVDSGGASCESEEMLDYYLEQATYKRWIKAGTLYGSTDYSMICITDENPESNPYVTRPFWVEYKYLVSLVMAQKEGIALLAEKVERCIKGLDKKGLIKKKQARKLIAIEEEYVSFRNQLMVLKVSCQEQGMELYQQLQKQMMVKEDKELLEEQLGLMYECVNVSNGTVINNLGIWIAVGAIVIDIIFNILLTLYTMGA